MGITKSTAGDCGLQIPCSARIWRQFYRKAVQRHCFWMTEPCYVGRRSLCGLEGPKHPAPPSSTPLAFSLKWKLKVWFMPHSETISYLEVELERIMQFVLYKCPQRLNDCLVDKWENSNLHSGTFQEKSTRYFPPWLEILSPTGCLTTVGVKTVKDAQGTKRPPRSVETG